MFVENNEVSSFSLKWKDLSIEMKYIAFSQNSIFQKSKTSGMKKPENDFDRIAPVYDWLGFVVFGDTILQAQQALISHIPERATILFIGGGTGKILPEILKRDPVRVCYVEKSEKMLARAKKRTQSTAVDWINGDENHPAVKSGNFDVVITFFLLDLFDEPSLHHLMQNLTNTLPTNGLWLFADFAPKNHHFFARLLLRCMYVFFRLTATVQAHYLADFRALFEELGFHKVQNRDFYFGLIESTVYRKTPSEEDKLHRHQGNGNASKGFMKTAK